MRVKLHANTSGTGPSERVVAIKTAQGHPEEVIVHSSLVEDNGLKVSQIGAKEDSVLIELPQESVEGNWRIWVPAASMS